MREEKTFWFVIGFDDEGPFWVNGDSRNLYYARRLLDDRRKEYPNVDYKIYKLDLVPENEIDDDPSEWEDDE